jgi:hypothetical protein
LGEVSRKEARDWRPGHSDGFGVLARLGIRNSILGCMRLALQTVPSFQSTSDSWARYILRESEGREPQQLKSKVNGACFPPIFQRPYRGDSPSNLGSRDRQCTQLPGDIHLHAGYARYNLRAASSEFYSLCKLVAIHTSSSHVYYPQELHQPGPNSVDL